MMASLNKKSYIICAPAYSEKSAGVRMLYSLRDELEQRGFIAKIFCFDKKRKHQDKNIIISKITEENRQNDIVIYPEVITGNPLLFRNVVRYALNIPGLLGGEASFHHSEVLFAFDDHCTENGPYLRQDMLDRKLFCNSQGKRDVNCYFVYKRGKFREVDEIKDCIEINCSWPKTRRELAKLLQRTNILYSYDDNSCLLQEAILCGVQVKIIEQDKIVDYKMNDIFDAELFEKQMDYFLKITQTLDYKGKINKKGFYTIKDFCKFFLERNYWKLKHLLTQSSEDKQKLTELKKMMPKIYEGGRILF